MKAPETGTQTRPKPMIPKLKMEIMEAVSKRVTPAKRCVPKYVRFSYSAFLTPVKR